MIQLRLFLILVFLFSIPLWIIGFIFDATKIIPVKLPISALQFFCVIFSAIIVTKKFKGLTIPFLKSGFDFHRIKNKNWQVAVFILLPLTVLLSYFLTKHFGVLIKNKSTPIWNIPFFLLIYGLSGYCEEIGWTAIAVEKLLTRFNIIITGLVVGIIWALWHIIPFIQTNNTTIWVIWQSIFTVTFRVLMTKIYVVTNRSIFATIALHTTYNTAFSMLPYYGSTYNPMYMFFSTMTVGIVVFILFKGHKFEQSLE
jgi:membrane protease YdiL (CAAX protease family)